jgi:hypothetical protein
LCFSLGIKTGFETLLIGGVAEGYCSKCSKSRRKEGPVNAVSGRRKRSDRVNKREVIAPPFRTLALVSGREAEWGIFRDKSGAVKVSQLLERQLCVGRVKKDNGF